MRKFTTSILIMTFALLMLSGCNEKKNEPASDVPVDDGTVKDICGNKYKCVKIGEQVWMAENMRCNKYDTQSERGGVEIDIFHNDLPSTMAYAPYYINASDNSTWKTDKYVTNDLLQQIEKLGYMYNWAAAVGLDDDHAKSQTTPFEGNRQGICPNGWHVPTDAEWNVLAPANFEGPNSGKKLKSTSGWYDNGNGTDDYSFAALPAGIAQGNKVESVGLSAFFWTATPHSGTTAYIRHMRSLEDYLHSSYHYFNYSPVSVRCVKN